MAYERSVNPEWKVGMTVEYHRAHHRLTDEPKLVTIKRISPKLQVAVCDIPRYDGTIEERKFQLGWLDYASETTKGYSRYKAQIVVPSAVRTQQREDARKLADGKARQSEAIQKLVDYTKYYVLNDHMLDVLESMVVAIEAMKAKESSK